MAAEYPHSDCDRTSEGQKGGEVTASATYPATECFRLDARRAVSAGALATLLLTVLWYLTGPWFGTRPFDVAQILGTMFYPPGGPLALAAGLLWHFGNGILFTLLYAWVLLSFNQQSNWITGLAFGAFLFLLAMLMLPVLMLMHPLVHLERVENPGPFFLGWNDGWRPAWFQLLCHLAFGAAVGALYRHHLRASRCD